MQNNEPNRTINFVGGKQMTLKRNIGRILQTLSAIVVVIIVGYLFLFNWQNPEYTRMMLLKKFWVQEIIIFLSIISFFIGTSLYEY